MSHLAENKRAGFDYEILEKFEAGIVLIGTEVKSIKSGHMSLAGSYVVSKNNELYLINANVPPYQPKNAPKDYDPLRSRKILIQKSEIAHLADKVHERGLTLLPLNVYTKGGKIKLEFGLALGKKKIDKRERIKKRDTDREIERNLKNY